ncbi:MAG: nucleotidyltransferase [Acidobacteria bacterium]|nr:MAG: nucleotidyltransferase [Acidobacteriota bacterium]
MNKPSILIMAAGMGSRYGGLKQLDEIGPHGETILEFSLYDAIQAGFGKVVFIIRKSFEREFKLRFSERWRNHIQIEYAYQEINPVLPGMNNNIKREKPWGTGHAVLCARPFINEPFAVINADDFYGRRAFEKMAAFLRNKCQPDAFCMIAFELGKTLSPNGSVSRGVCKVDENGLLSKIQEVSGIEKRGQAYRCASETQITLSDQTPVSMNFWGFHPDFFHSLQHGFLNFAKQNRDQSRAEFYLPSHVFHLIQQGKAKVHTQSSPDSWYGITYSQDKPLVREATSKLIQQQIYSSPLWNAL